jgi:hypothetical protein
MSLAEARKRSSLLQKIIRGIEYVLVNFAASQSKMELSAIQVTLDKQLINI